MKIATWNINSVRARVERLIAWIELHQPDIVCLQEIKCVDSQFPVEALRALGFESAVFGQKAYNGVAIISKTPLSDVRRNMDDGDPQARVLSAVVNGIRVVTVYAPNGQGLNSEAYVYKLQWYEKLSRWLAATQPSETEMLICGDFNIAPTDVDIYDASLWGGQTLASPPERERFFALMESHQLADAFRLRKPQERLFSWWDYRMGSFHRNEGLRIDTLLITKGLEARLTGCEIDREARKGKLPSDHAPVWLTLT